MHYVTKGKFRGQLYHLKHFVREAGVECYWRIHLNDGHQFNCCEGGSLIWWPSTKTVVLQGAWTSENKNAIRKKIYFGPDRNPLIIEAVDEMFASL